VDPVSDPLLLRKPGNAGNRTRDLWIYSQELRVLENRVLRRIFGLKRDEMTRGRRKLHNEKLHSLYSSPGIIRIIKSRRMRWVGKVARTGF
jgi:hypothetical protein